MKTSYFGKSVEHPNAVSIALGRPKGWMRPLKVYRPLNPDAWMLKLFGEEYEREYRKKLAKLNPRKVWLDLVELAGEDAVLLCFEKDPRGCHRRIVAAWFKETLGFDVPELDYRPPDKKVVQFTLGL